MNLLFTKQTSSLDIMSERLYLRFRLMPYLSLWVIHIKDARKFYILKLVYSIQSLLKIL